MFLLNFPAIQLLHQHNNKLLMGKKYFFCCGKQQINKQLLEKCNSLEFNVDVLSYYISKNLYMYRLLKVSLGTMAYSWKITFDSLKQLT